MNFATSSPSELKMKEVNKALNYIQEIASGEDSNGDRIPVNIIWGTSIKPELEDKIEIIIVVTGFHANAYYSETFGGRLDLEDEVKVVAPQPAEPVVVAPQPQPEPVAPKVAAPRPQAEPVAPKVVVPQPQPEHVAPKVVVPQPQPVAPKVVVPQQPTTPVTPTPQPVVEEELSDEPWRVPIPARKEVRPIPPQVLPTSYKLDSKTPAYKTRRGMELINEVKGKKIIIKMDGTKSQSEDTPNDSMQQSLDF